MELHLHPPVLVGIDLVVLRPDHHRGLRSVGQRLRRRALRPKRNRRVLAVQRELEARPFVARGRVRILPPEVFDADDQVLAVLIGPRTAVEIEQVAGRDPSRIRLSLQDFMRSVQLLEPHLGVELAFRNLRVAARIVVDPVVGIRVLVRMHVPLLQLRTRLAEIEVVGHEPARVDLLRHDPALHVLFVGERRRVRRDVRNRRIFRQRLMRPRRIGQHQLELPQLVLEEIVDPLVLHQPADEIEIGLLVLHAVIPGPIGTRQPLLHHVRILAEHLRQDRRRIHLLEDLAIRRPRHVPDPRPHHRLVAVEPPVAADQREPRHLAVQVAPPERLRLHFHRDVLAEQAVHRDVRRHPHHLQAELEQPRQLFLPRQRLELERLRPEWRMNGEDARHPGFLIATAVKCRSRTRTPNHAPTASPAAAAGLRSSAAGIPG